MLGREARELLTGRKAIERALILRSSRDRWVTDNFDIFLLLIVLLGDWESLEVPEIWTLVSWEGETTIFGSYCFQINSKAMNCINW
jgi:hypothetical protein